MGKRPCKVTSRGPAAAGLWVACVQGLCGVLSWKRGREEVRAEGSGGWELLTAETGTSRKMYLLGRSEGLGRGGKPGGRPWQEPKRRDLHM